LQRQRQQPIGRGLGLGIDAPHQHRAIGLERLLNTRPGLRGRVRQRPQIHDQHGRNATSGNPRHTSLIEGLKQHGGRVAEKRDSLNFADIGQRRRRTGVDHCLRMLKEPPRELGRTVGGVGIARRIKDWRGLIEGQFWIISWIEHGNIRSKSLRLDTRLTFDKRGCEMHAVVETRRLCEVVLTNGQRPAAVVGHVVNRHSTDVWKWLDLFFDQFIPYGKRQTFSPARPAFVSPPTVPFTDFRRRSAPEIGGFGHTPGLADCFMRTIMIHTRSIVRRRDGKTSAPIAVTIGRNPWAGRV